MPKYYLAVEIQPRFLLFLFHKIKMSKHLFSKLSLTYRVNVSHQESVHHPLSTLPVWEQRIPWQLLKQISKLFFQVTSQVYSVPDQIEGRRETLLQWTSIDSSTKLSLTCEDDVNYYKSIHHPIPNLPVRIGNTLAIFKTNQLALLLTECPGIFSSWPNRRGEESHFWRVQEGGLHCEIMSKNTCLS